MKTLCFLLCITYASCFYIDNEGKSKDKIVGGDFRKIEEVPYQATILWFTVVNNCGASIIHESWILTAAHCVENKSHLSVRTGSGYKGFGGEIHKVKKIYMHPRYDTVTNDNDIALLKLEEPIVFNDVQRPIPIAKSYDIPKVGQLMKISGFGKVLDNGGTSSILKAAYVPIVDQKDCEKAYVRDPITSNMFCAGDGAADACQGDSGGPGVINGKLHGIVSSGMKCASKEYPGIYTRVHKYYDWIVQTSGLVF